MVWDIVVIGGTLIFTVCVVALIVVGALFLFRKAIG